VKGIKHIAADRLSRRPYYEEDLKDNLNIDKFIALKLDIVKI